MTWLQTGSGTSVVLTASARKGLPFVQSSTSEPRPHVDLIVRLDEGSFIETQTGLHVVLSVKKTPSGHSGGYRWTYRTVIRPASQDERLAWEVLSS